MKKLITTIILSVVFFGAFAQKHFKQLNYYTGSNEANMLDYGVFNTGKAVKPRALTGVININMADSTIDIIDGGVAKDKFKIKTMQSEVTDQNGNKSLIMFAVDPKYGFEATITMLREPANTAKKEMKFIIKYKDGSGRTYPCVFLENLFEN
jgi:hypothetical protein